MKLNAREEKYCQLVANGELQYVAHKKAGYKAKTKQAHAAHSSCLMTRPEILDRIKELRELVTKSEIITREEVVKFLADSVKARPEDASMDSPLCELKYVGKEAIPVAVLPDKLGAINHLNRMMGWNAPDKVELSGAVEVIEFD